MSTAPSDEEVCRCEGMCGGRAVSEGEGISNRGTSLACDSESSTEVSGMSGLLSVCGESFLFFVEDVVPMSCLCSSVVRVGGKEQEKTGRFLGIVVELKIARLQEQTDCG